MSRRRFAQELCHPLSIAAIALLLVNDHLLKGAGLLPGSVTGKVSDVAGLFFFPLLLLAGMRAMFPRARRWPIDVAVLATGAGFAALKLWPRFNAALEPIWGVNTLDPTDLLALPALGASWLFAVSLERRRRGMPSRLGQGMAVGLAALATMATPPPRMARNYPAWAVSDHATQQLRCARAHAWIAKSGKTGAGLAIELRRSSGGPGACRIQLVEAALVITGGPTIAASRLPDAVVFGPGEGGRHHWYIPFAFDNNQLWNSGKRRGELRLRARVRGAPIEWRMGAEHRLSDYHRRRR